MMSETPPGYPIAYLDVRRYTRLSPAEQQAIDQALGRTDVFRIDQAYGEWRLSCYEMPLRMGGDGELASYTVWIPAPFDLPDRIDQENNDE